MPVFLILSMFLSDWILLYRFHNSNFNHVTAIFFIKKYCCKLVHFNEILSIFMLKYSIEIYRRTDLTKVLPHNLGLRKGKHHNLWFISKWSLGQSGRFGMSKIETNSDNRKDRKQMIDIQSLKLLIDLSSAESAQQIMNMMEKFQKSLKSARHDQTWTALLVIISFWCQNNLRKNNIDT